MWVFHLTRLMKKSERDIGLAGKSDNDGTGNSLLDNGVVGCRKDDAGEAAIRQNLSG